MTLISQRERTELRRIVKARFDILDRQLHNREQEVARLVRQQIEQEYSDAATKMMNKVEKLQEKMEKIAAEAKAVEQEAAELGLISDDRRGRGRVLTYEFTEGFSPKDLGPRVKRAVAEIKSQASLHGEDLALKRLELEEELAIGALETDSAKGFLEKVPDIDSLLPLNGNIAKAIEATATEAKND